MIRRPADTSARRVREFVVGLLPGIVAAGVLLGGAFYMQSAASHRLVAAQKAASLIKAPVPESVIDGYTNDVNQAEAALDEVVTQRNDAVATISRLDKIASELPQGARLVNYGQNASIQIEGIDNYVLGDTAKRWAEGGFTVAVSTSQTGQPGNSTTPAIEPNANFTVSDALLTPAPAATPAPVASAAVQIPSGGTR